MSLESAFQAFLFNYFFTKYFFHSNLAIIKNHDDGDNRDYPLKNIIMVGRPMSISKLE